MKTDHYKLYQKLKTFNVRMHPRVAFRTGNL